MPNAKSRIAALERELSFRSWVECSRFFEGLTEEQLKEVALNWRFPDPLPEPLPWGMSSLDSLDRKTLLRLWEESEREISRIMHEAREQSEDDFRFCFQHGRWPSRGGRS